MSLRIVTRLLKSLGVPEYEMADIGAIKEDIYVDVDMAIDMRMIKCLRPRGYRLLSKEEFERGFGICRPGGVVLDDGQLVDPTLDDDIPP